MVYTDSKGKKHVSIHEAATGHAAKTTASRNARGDIVGNSRGSNYAREQEAKAQERSNSSRGIQLADGSYIPQVQIEGRRDGNVKVYSSKAEMTAAHNEQARAAAELARQQAAFRVLKDKDGKAIAAIQTHGNLGKGSHGVRIIQREGRIDENGVFHQTSSRVVAVSRTTGEYKREERIQKRAEKVKGYSTLRRNKILYEAGKRLSAGKELTEAQKNVIALYSTTEKWQYSKLANQLAAKGISLSQWLGRKTGKTKVTAATDKIPVVGSVVKGLYDITEVPEGLGEAVKGTERWRQNKKSVLPSMSVGTGMLVGSIETDPVRFAASLVAMEGLGRGVKAVGKNTGIKSTKLQEVSPGEAAAVRDIKTGYSVVVRGKPIVSYSKATGKVKKGAAGASKKAIEGKKIQAFSKADTKAFEETLKQFSKIEQKYYAAGKKIADTAYSQKNPVTKPRQLDILSEHIPVNMKPVVKATITKYGGLFKTRDIQVYGSVPQKLQMKGFMSRSPKDIEISVSNASKFISNFRANAKKAGFIEGVDYKITGKADSPKIQFKIEGKWEKGVEVFPSKKLEKVYKVEPGYRLQDGIAYGFKNKKSVKIEGTKAMKLQEQAARKFAGGTTLKDGKLEPVHTGRVKDVRDLIEIGTAYEVTAKTGIAKEIITYAKIAAKKHPEILESPIVSFIVKNRKLPTKTQLEKLIVEAEAKARKTKTKKTAEKELLYSSKSRSISVPKTRASSGLSAASRTSKSKSASKASNASKTTSVTSKASKTSTSRSKASTSRSKNSASKSRASKSKGIKYKTIHAKFVPSSKSKTSTSTSVSKSKPSTSKSRISKPKPSGKSKGTGSVRVTPPKTVIPVAIKRRKRSKTIEVKPKRAYIRGERKVKNTLGNMKSMLG